MRFGNTGFGKYRFDENRFKQTWVRWKSFLVNIGCMTMTLQVIEIL